jgi:hypothetical protein
MTNAWPPIVVARVLASALVVGTTSFPSRAIDVAIPLSTISATPIAVIQRFLIVLASNFT